MNDNSVCGNRTLQADSVGMRETTTKTILVKPEGASRDYTFTDYVCTDSKPNCEPALISDLDQPDFNSL